ncbi:sulfatase-like hydrolase/transferase [Polycladospora coralii]|uniref:sulfatase-like hydrolase/transferase n=1 Tax=Polycladospora coralii TaxID=2771432 RepID=UPI0020BE993A|nr:sulfatase-like hydrolase/transferase [Polycladospora coralii]
MKRPNFLILMVDKERFSTAYETAALQDWRKQNLSTRQFLQDNGFSFQHHYTNSTACSPSRATLYTGQYPSLHGVTQTSGVAKYTYNPDIFWLDPNSVPTMGDYFRTAGYQT